MNRLYDMDPQAYETRRKTAQEEKVITLKDDHVPRPATVGTPLLQGILFGPAAMQPSSAAGEARPGWGRRAFKTMLWMAAAVLVGAGLWNAFFRDVQP